MDLSQPEHLVLKAALEEFRDATPDVDEAGRLAPTVTEWVKGQNEAPFSTGELR
ncbi:hypothetical protein [Nonomuraea recticatena]|uniref:hypothetical protein n=1 Tax=Nonomuraea recticatena TaxID=46178 RepID=UPI00361091DD